MEIKTIIIIFILKIKIIIIIKNISRQKFLIAILALLTISNPLHKALSQSSNPANYGGDCTSPSSTFWGSSLGCAWKSSDGKIASYSPDGATCYSIRTQNYYIFWIQVSSQTIYERIPCPN